MWHHAGNGQGLKDMVVLPYKDRLVLFSKYLQQLVMESLGKEHDLDGNVVNQGIAVYGNKGSTDQHAYVQQLRDGVNNFFATFIEVQRERERPGAEVEPVPAEPAPHEVHIDDPAHRKLGAQLQRAMADMANLRKRMHRDIEDARRRAIEGLSAELLPVLDTFHLALGVKDQQESEQGSFDAKVMVESQKHFVQSPAYGPLPKGTPESVAAAKPLRLKAVRKRRRNRAFGWFVALAMHGGIATAGWFGYQAYQDDQDQLDADRAAAQAGGSRGAPGALTPLGYWNDPAASSAICAALNPPINAAAFFISGPSFGPSCLKFGLACSVAKVDESVENSTAFTLSSSAINPSSA